MSGKHVLPKFTPRARGALAVCNDRLYCRKRCHALITRRSGKSLSKSSTGPEFARPAKTAHPQIESTPEQEHKGTTPSLSGRLLDKEYMRRKWFATESDSQGFHLRLPSSRTPGKLPWLRISCSSENTDARHTIRHARPFSTWRQIRACSTHNNFSHEMFCHLPSFSGQVHCTFACEFGANRGKEHGHRLTSENGFAKPCFLMPQECRI